jgi:hypothetical protein
MSTISNNGISPTFIQTFDSTMSPIRSFLLPENIARVQLFNDTFFCLCDNDSGTQPTNMVKAYDLNFQELYTWNLSESIKGFTKAGAGDFYIGPGGIFCFRMESYMAGGYEVLFFDHDKRFLGRCCLPGHIVGSDAANRICWYDEDALLFIITLQNNQVSTSVIR